jgi:hypothetical protein
MKISRNLRVKRVLDGVNERPLAGSGCGSFCRGPMHWIPSWGLPMGSIPAAEHWRWARLINATYWRWARLITSSYEFRTALCVCYILYVGQWKFRCNMSSDHREGGPRSSIALGRHVCCSTSTARRPSPRIEDGEGVVAPRSATDSTEQWV